MGMGWTRILAENRIQEAMENGEFDHLPGKGKPLDLSDYFRTPVADRLGHSLLKSAGVLPPELELLKQAESLEDELKTCEDPTERARLRQEIQNRRVSFRLKMEQRKNSPGPDTSLAGPVG
jgi:hypothetical protein